MLKQCISFCVDNNNIQSDLCPEINDISVKQYVATTWLFPLGLSPLVPWSIDPSSAKRETLLWSVEDEEEALSVQSSLPWVPQQPGAGLSLTPCSKQMRMFNTVNV